MANDRNKIFKDSVHGYIEIPSIVVSELIDTEQFQRLRNIEQTSMRSLYPSARHDRFIHSLGVYNLGKKVFREFRKNSESVIKSLKDYIDRKDYELLLNEKWWNKQQLLFEIACLMHDCAHAPFSHTTEDYYYLKTGTDGTPKLKAILEAECKKLGDNDFKYDFNLKKKSDGLGLGAAHEKLSSYIVLKEYADPIRKVFKTIYPSIEIENPDLVFICRMILGCKYIKENDITYSLKNCIISLLNSSTIDVDGLDYIVRDSQMSGASSYNIDYHRIINSFTILPTLIYNNVQFEKDEIEGIWIKNSSFVFSSFSGKIKGALVTSVNDSTISKPFGDVNRGENGSNNYDYSDTISFYNSKDGEISLTSSAKIEEVKDFYGKVNGIKLLQNPKENLKIGKLSFVLGYDKRCLSIIQNTIDARNNEYLWIYSHPKVQYNSNYLQCALLLGASKYLCYKVNQENNKDLVCKDCTKCAKNLFIGEKSVDSEYNSYYEDYISQIFGYKEFFDSEDRQICNNLHKLDYYFYRSNDDDINALFKRIYLSISNSKNKYFEEFQKLYKEYSSRKQRKVLWKSFMEKEVIKDACKAEKSEFRGFSDMIARHKSSKTRAYSSLDKEEQEIFDKYNLNDVIIIYSSAKTKKIDFAEFFVSYGDRFARLCDVFDSSMITEPINRDIEYIFYNGADVDTKTLVEIDQHLYSLYREGKNKEGKKKR